MFSRGKRKLLALPLKIRGLGKPLFSDISNVEYENSKLLTKTLREKIINQDRRYESDQKITKIKREIAPNKLKRSKSIKVFCKN